MKTKLRRLELVLSALFVSLLVQIRADSYGTGGYLGCRFSKEVCRWDENCFDDHLFGTCQKYPLDAYKYKLDVNSLDLLQREVIRLVNEGYQWQHIYTQCVLGNLLLAFRSNQEPDVYWCDRQEGQSTVQLENQAVAMLENYLENYAAVREKQERKGNGEEVLEYDGYPLGGSSADNNDEFVTVHKYFSNEKRSNEEGEVRSEIDRVLSELLGRMKTSDAETVKENLNQGYNMELEDYPAKTEGYSEEIEDYPVMAEDYSMMTEDYPDMAEDYPAMTKDYPAAAEDYPEQLKEFDDESSEYELEGNTFPDANDEYYNFDGELEEENPFVNRGGILSQEDAAVLEDIIEDKVSIDDLDEEQIRRLLNYVNVMLKGLKQEDVPLPEEQQISMEVLKDEEVKRTDGEAVKAEQMNENVLQNPGGRSHIRVISKKEPALAINPNQGKHLMEDGLEVEAETLPDHHDHHFDDSMVNTHTQGPKYDLVEANYGYIELDPAITDVPSAVFFLQNLERILNLDPDTLSMRGVTPEKVLFEVQPNPQYLDAEEIGKLTLELNELIKNVTGFRVVKAGIGRENQVSITPASPKFFILTFVLCATIAAIVLAVLALYIVRNYTSSREKLSKLSNVEGPELSKDYQDLCRQRMQGKADKPEPLSAASRVGCVSQSEVRSPSSRSSTSSWSEEPVQSNMDISTGHIVLSYMEDHLKNKDRLDEEWTGLEAYEAEPNGMAAAKDTSNMRRNRYTDVLPYDHSRVVLNSGTNVSGSDYINASSITDHDPRNPAYIATQGPLPHTVADFWQMVWEQGCVVIVQLTKLAENGVAMCHRYWPEEGSDLYHIYEVHLVSEHIWCDDYLVRSFYLKNLQTNETRTVTQFHFLTWPDLGIPTSTKALLDFRRKVNKSYRGRSCPILVHCSDGIGRTGTYCLIDMVLNRLSKGAKEIDIAATLEHILDQRMGMVKTKEQFEFALASVAEEVHAILKALPQ